jgi:ABC-type multidrug transport system fused ATPase/permease subunit
MCKKKKADDETKDSNEPKPKPLSCDKGSFCRSKICCFFCCGDMFENNAQDEDDDDEQSKCCGGKKPWPENPNAPWSRGNCRDFYCIILYILFWGLMIAVAVSAFIYGSVPRVLYATDFDGQSCGTSEGGTRLDNKCPRNTECPEDLSSKKRVAYPRMGTDLIMSMAEGFDTNDVSGSIKNIRLYGICVESCPQTGDYVCNYKGESDYLPLKAGASASAAERKQAVYDCYDEMYDSGMNPSLSGVPGMGTLSAAFMSQTCIDIVGNCWINPIDTQSLLWRCIPKFWSTDNSDQACQLPATTGNATAGTLETMSYLNPACITIHKTDKSEVDIPKGAEIVFDLMSGIAGRIMRSVSDLYNSWYVVFVCGVVLSFAASWGWVIFLQYFVSFVVWTTVVAFYLTWIAATLVLYMKGDILTINNIVWLANWLINAIAGDFSYSSSLSGLIEDATNSTSDPTPSVLASSSTYKLYFQIGAYVMTAAFFLLVIVGIVLYKKIKVAIAIIRESAKALQALPTLVFYPLWSIFLLSLIGFWWALVQAFLMSAGTLSVNDLSSNFDYNTTGLPSEFADATASVKKYESFDVIKGLMVIHLFGCFWTVYLIEGLGLTVIATSISAWYFTKEVDWVNGTADDIERWKHDIDDKPIWSHNKPFLWCLPAEHCLQPCTFQRFVRRFFGCTKCCFCGKSCTQMRQEKALKKAEKEAAAEASSDDDGDNAAVDGDAEASGDDEDDKDAAVDAPSSDEEKGGEEGGEEEAGEEEADQRLCAEAHGCPPILCCDCKAEKPFMPRQVCCKIHKGEDYNNDGSIDCAERFDVRPKPGCILYALTCCCYCQLCCYCCKNEVEKDKCYKWGCVRYCISHLRQEACPRNNRPDIEVCVCVKGCFRAHTFHLGPILIGAFLIAVIQTLRVVMLYIERMVKQAAGKSKGPLIKKIFKVVQAILWLFAQCMKFITRNTYIMVAMRNLGFARASATAVGLLVSNVFVMSLVKIFSVAVIIIGKVIVVCISAGVAIAWLSFSPEFNFDGARPLNGTIFQTVLTACCAVIVAQIFFYTFQMTIDTILLCFCEDCYQHDGVPQRNATLRDVIHKNTNKRPVEAAIIYKRASKTETFEILVKVDKWSLKDLKKNIKSGNRIDSPGIPKIADMELVIYDKRAKKFMPIATGKLRNSKIHAIYKRKYPIFMRSKGDNYPEDMTDASGNLNEQLRALLNVHGIKVSATKMNENLQRAKQSGKTVLV